MDSSENSNKNMFFFDTAKSRFETKLRCFGRESRIKNVIWVVHSYYMSPEFLKFLATSYLPYFASGNLAKAQFKQKSFFHFKKELVNQKNFGEVNIFFPQF